MPREACSGRGGFALGSSAAVALVAPAALAGGEFSENQAAPCLARVALLVARASPDATNSAPLATRKRAPRKKNRFPQAPLRRVRTAAPLKPLARVGTRGASSRVAVKRAGLFPITTLDTYDFTRPIDRDVVQRAATLDFVRERTNVVFLGPSGVGKTHLANALGYLACVEGYRVRFALAADLVNDLVASQTRNTLSKRLSAWTSHDLLLIDELGHLSFDSRGADLLYQVINKRYLRASTIVTTNLPFKDWGNLFHNAAAASAIADRLVHKGLLGEISPQKWMNFYTKVLSRFATAGGLKLTVTVDVDRPAVRRCRRSRRRRWLCASSGCRRASTSSRERASDDGRSISRFLGAEASRVRRPAHCKAPRRTWRARAT